jgi:prevent-host-death family protein
VPQPRRNLSRPPRDPGPLPREPTAAREVPIRKLDRHASEVVAAVTEGEVAVITRYGVPVAVILPARDALRLLPIEYVMGGPLRALSVRLVERERRQASSALMHGRWYQPELD